MTRPSSSAARRLAAAALAWLFLLTSPALAQLAPVMSAFATPDADLDVVRMTFSRPDDQFSYFTPGDSMFRVGVGSEGSAQTTFAENDLRPPLSGPALFGARLDRDVGPVDLALSGRVGAVPRTALGIDAPTIWSTGVEIGLRGLSIAGFYTERNGEDANGGHSYDASLRYRTGPWGFALAFNSVATAQEASGNEVDRLEQYTLALNYHFAPGAQFGAFGRYVAAGPGPDANAPAIEDDISGFVFGTGLRFEF